MPLYEPRSQSQKLSTKLQSAYRWWRKWSCCHHGHYSGDHVVSENYLNEEANNTPFFLIPVTLAISLGYLALPLDLFIVQLIAMSISFFVHLYLDKHYHVTGSFRLNQANRPNHDLPLCYFLYQRRRRKPQFETSPFFNTARY
jgi:hypothetical protein